MTVADCVDEMESEAGGILHPLPRYANGAGLSTNRDESDPVADQKYRRPHGCKKRKKPGFYQPITILDSIALRACSRSLPVSIR